MYSISFLVGSCPISQQDFRRVQAILQKCSHKWKKIAQGLGFTANELAIIKARPALLMDAPTSFLDAMLAEWQQWAPGDARGSTSYATLHALRKAVNEAGLGLTAQEL